MNKHELEFQRLRISATKLSMFYGALKRLMECLTLVACAKFFFEALALLGSANPEAVTALGGLVEKMNLGTISGYLLAGGATVGWAAERRGKKRLLKGFSDDRNKHEVSDAYNASSGLTPSGDTPK